jgi:starvation-inducible DNA-binding protein
MKIDIGLSDTEREQIAKGLSKLLADSYTLYLKTQNFHWNVTGPHFKSLHLTFEEQYVDLASAVDLIAERIRALGVPTPASYAQFSKLTSIKEETKVPSWENMIKQLVEGNEIVVRTARDLFSVVEKAEDEVTLNMLAERMEIHEKNAWMLRSSL